MKRVNILYIVWILALAMFLWLMNGLKTQVTKTIFGTAITESYSINVEYATIVSERRVQQGDRVKKGDTLLILLRSEMDKNITDIQALINQFDVDRITKNLILDKEEELFKAQQNSKKTEIQAQIKIAEKEMEIQNNLRKSIGENKAMQTNNIKELELSGLNESLNQLNLQALQQQKSYAMERQANNKNYEAKLALYKNDINYYQLEKFKMIIVSPCDGIVENVFVLPKDMAPQYKELMRINSSSPNKVTGFIHEGMSIPFKLGDTVRLISAARPEVKTNGIILANGNNLVELPLRLRKFIEIRVWGREIYIKMDADNGFYIDEKIIIQIN